jgi:hypothetical protein
MFKKILSVIVSLVLFIAAVSMLNTSKSDAEMKKKAVLLLNPEKGIQCSGEQIQAPSGKTYILSAAHCRVIADSGDSIEVHDAEGRVINRKVVAEDPNSDLLLLEGLPDTDGLRVAPFDTIDEHVRTYTHGRGMPTYKTEGNILGYKWIEASLGKIEEGKVEECSQFPKNRVVTTADPFFGSLSLCVMGVNETMTTALVVGGSSGGMVVNDDGELVGVVSVEDGPFSGMVRLTDINNFLRSY